MPTYRVTGPDGRTIRMTGPREPTAAEIRAAFRSRIDKAIDMLPAAGGAIGGLVGGVGGTVGGFGVGGVPGAIGGAGLGGAFGESVRQLVNRARGREGPGTSLQAAKAIGREGATQAAAEAAGAGVVRGLRTVGRGLMESAVRPTEALLREFPDVVETLIKERLPVGRGVLPSLTKRGPAVLKGSQKAKAALSASAGTTRQQLAFAEQLGKEFEPSRLVQPVTDLESEIRKRGIAGPSLRQVKGLKRAFLREHQAPMTPTAVKDLKRAEQALARPVFQAQRKGGFVPGSAAVEAEFSQRLAEGARRALEDIPGVAESEARTQALIGALRALQRAEARRLPLFGELAALGAGTALGATTGSVAGGLGGYLALRAATSPRTLSRAALGLTGPVVTVGGRQIPRALFEALRENQEP